MQHPFETLKHEYAAWIDNAVIRPEKQHEVSLVAAHLVSVADHFRAGCDATEVPIAWAAPSFQRESSCDFRCSPAQGDRWDHVSHNVPAGRGPFPSFTAAQIDAYKIDGLEKVGRANWTLERACYYWEIFNGLGYRDVHHIRSPYVVGALTEQQPGKYVADRVWGEVMDTQLGTLAMYLEMVKIDPSLALPRESGVAATTQPSPPPAPSAVHQNRDMFWIQAALNEDMRRDSTFLSYVRSEGGGLLRVDGELGRNTRAVVRAFETLHHLDVDAGIPGTQVTGALDQILGAGWSPTP